MIFITQKQKCLDGSMRKGYMNIILERAVFLEKNSIIKITEKENNSLTSPQTLHTHINKINHFRYQ